MEIREIVRLLNDRAEEVARYLLPGGRKSGHEWRCGDVWGSKSQDLDGGSFAIHISGNKAGWAKDFSSGWSGDLIDVWREAKGATLREALEEAKRFLGIVDPLRKAKRTYARPQKPKGLKKPKPKSSGFEYLTGERKLSSGTLEAFRIGEAVISYGERKGNSIIFPYLREPDESGGKCECFNIKCLLVERPNGKKIQRFSVAGAELGLFGWQAINLNSRVVIICEGEVDALTWKEYGHEALSMPNGIGAADWIENEWENLERFETIYISVDNEETSQKQVPKLFERLGYHRCLNIELPFKDINKCLQQGVSKVEIDTCVQSARPLDPEELKAPILYLTEVLDKFYQVEHRQEPGFSPSFETRLRFRPSEFTLLAGESNHGKTTLVRQVVIDAGVEGSRVALASLEDPPATTLYKAVRQVCGEKQPKPDTIERAMRWMNEWLKVFTVVGTQKMDRILGVFEYAFRRYGCTVFVLDNLTKLGIPPDDYPKQEEIANKLSDFAIRTQGHVILVHHTKKGDYDRDVPDRKDIKGSGGITDIAHNVLTLWRSQKHTEQHLKEMTGGRKRNGHGDVDAVLRIIKHKNTDSDSYESAVGLYFHPECYIFTATKNESPFLYVDAIPSLPVQPEGEYEVF